MSTEKRVKAGAAWLDGFMPRWIERVNLDTLRMTDAYNCVLGQVVGVGDWDKTLHVAGLGDARAKALGFNMLPGESPNDLANAWRALIDKRHGQQVTSVEPESFRVEGWLCSYKTGQTFFYTDDESAQDCLREPGLESIRRVTMKEIVT